ncbi:MAG: hypothetical protein ACI8ZB_002446 [Desulforhopalus sp.]|jgi:hypothetical protein
MRVTFNIISWLIEIVNKLTVLALPVIGMASAKGQ